MKICMINPPIQMNRRLYYPIGICYVAASLREHGHHVEVIDIIGDNISRKKFQELITQSDADCYGLGGLVTTFNHVVDISQMIRDNHPEAFIFAGNAVGSSIPEILLNHSCVDAIVIGEGEITTPDLINAIHNEYDLKNVDGIVYKDSKGDINYTSPRDPITDLDILPYPAWDLVHMTNYFDNFGKRTYPVSSVRGCPYNCTFCAKTFRDYKVRSHTPGYIIKELEEVNRLYGIESFIFFDDNFMFNKKRALDFCKLKAESIFKTMPWKASARANDLNEELIKALAESNCIELGIGFESLDQNILDYYNKRTTIEQYHRAAELCKKYNITISAGFLIGAPEESEEAIRRAYEFCKGYNIRYEAHFLTPYPKTKIYNDAVNEGKIQDELEFIRLIAKRGNTNDLTVNLTHDFTDDELRELREKYRYFPPKVKSTVRYYFDEAMGTYKNYGLQEFIRKTGKHMPQIINTVLSPYRSPKQEAFSNDWN